MIIAATAALMTACAAGPTHTADQASAAIAAATAANSQAAKVNYEWRDTGKMIKEAEKASKEGKFDDAVKLAKKAERQAKNALAQYEEQKNVKPML
ncbi:MAG: hypothetical protein R6X06_04345 [Gammaproteobacteria bacterium]